MAVIHNGEAYLFDRRDGAARHQGLAENGRGGTLPADIEHLFISHLHSDHTLDYPELAATYWWRCTDKLNAYGPKGLQAMTDAYYQMQATDIALRTGGNQPVEDPSLYQVDVSEIAADGVVYEGSGVTVEAFTVDHGDIEPAYGYKITTPDKTIVFSGERPITRP